MLAHMVPLPEFRSLGSGTQPAFKPTLPLTPGTRLRWTSRTAGAEDLRQSPQAPPARLVPLLRRRTPSLHFWMILALEKFRMVPGGECSPYPPTQSALHGSFVLNKSRFLHSHSKCCLSATSSPTPLPFQPE